MSLENLLREAAAKGLTHLSVHPVHSEDRKTVYWRASATPSTGHSYVQTANPDIAEAVRVVLDALPRAPRRAAPKPKEAKEQPQLDVTATVKERDPLDLHDGPNDEWERFKV